MNLNKKKFYDMNKSFILSIIDDVYKNSESCENIMIRLLCYTFLYFYIKNYNFYNFEDSYQYTDIDIEKLIDVIIDINDIDFIPSHVTIENIISIMIDTNIKHTENFLTGKISYQNYKDKIIECLSILFDF